MKSLGWFGLVGICALLTHLSIVYVLVTHHMAQPLYANIVAFCVSFIVSFFGHRALTFQSNDTTLRLPHFMLVTCLGLIVNESSYYVLLRLTPLNYMVALLMVLGMTSILTFTLSKAWACR